MTEARYIYAGEATEPVDVSLRLEDIDTDALIQGDARATAQAQELAGLLGIVFNEQGLVPAVVQQEGTGEVLMMAWMNAASLVLTLRTKGSWFWSRSRQELWNKGATSGNVQQVLHVLYDCDADTLLLEVDSPGPACHTGHRTCFYRELIAK